jgi:cation diffusion facilitator CzcD-associated flavoprotein CzcO
MLNINICGRSGKTLREKWAIRQCTLLGMMVAGFPNLFTITGSGSPADLSNMIPHIEENVKWIIKCIEYLKMHNINSIEPTIDAQHFWMDHSDIVAGQRLCSTDNSGYNGSNIPEKPSTAMRYADGLHNYLKRCEQVTMDGYRKFFLLKPSSQSPTSFK